MISDAVQIALIGAAGLTGAAVGAAFVKAFGDKKAAQYAREAKEGIDRVIHMVDGTQTAILEELRILTSERAGAIGELKGRDFTRQHMEARQDKLTESSKTGVTEG
jgi:hypothetical protein